MPPALAFLVCLFGGCFFFLPFLLLTVVFVFALSFFLLL